MISDNAYQQIPLPDTVPEYVWRMKPGRDEMSHRFIPTYTHASMEEALSAAKKGSRKRPGLSFGRRTDNGDGFVVFGEDGKPIEYHMLII